MWRLVREDRSLRFWRVLIFDPPTRRRRCNLSTFSVTPYTEGFCLCTQNSGKPPGRHRNKRVSQCEASTPTRYRTRYAPTVSAPAPLLHTATALQHTLSTAGAVVRYLPLPKPHLVNPSPPRSTHTLRASIAAALIIRDVRCDKALTPLRL